MMVDPERNLMAASRNTRYHEAAHAVAAHVLGIELEEEAMVLNSDQDAWVNVVAKPPDDADEDWFTRRVAVKLAGPLAMVRLRGEKLHWDVLRSSGEYDTDFKDSQKLFISYGNIVGRVVSNDELDQQMNRAACIAIKCVQTNQAAIVGLTDATEGKDSFSRTQVIACIQACQ
jgi:hypothetical protein